MRVPGKLLGMDLKLSERCPVCECDLREVGPAIISGRVCQHLAAAPAEPVTIDLTKALVASLKGEDPIAASVSQEKP